MAKSGLSILNPLEMWREALTQWEGTTNKVAGKQMNTEEFAKVLHSVSGATLGVQQAVTKANRAVLKEMNLASREDLVEIGERLHRIEDMLEYLCRQTAGKPPSTPTSPPMPPRTRKPPTAAAPVATAPASEVAPKVAADAAPEPASRPAPKAKATPSAKRPARKKA
jgi:hypothetical protein